MTAAAPTASRRPAKPRPSLAVPAGIIGFLVITWIAISDEFGIGLDVSGLINSASRLEGILWRESTNVADRGLLNPNWPFLPETFGPMVETFQMAVIASLIGCGVALPVAFLVSRVTTPSPVVFGVTRGVLSVIRAIPDLLYALIFIAALSVGPLAGILALIFFNIGVTAKLLSETVDGVDPGPVEAGRASGASRTQAVRWAVLPQVLPNYVAYSLYVFELNIRASAVLGLVGAGGIGRILFREYSLFHWSNMAVVIVEVFLVVIVVELISIRLRRRLV